MNAPAKQPAHVAAERACLGSCLASAQRIAAVAALLQPEDFSSAGHAALFSALVELEAHGRPVDIVTVSAALEAKGTLALVGGISGICQFDNDAPSSANALEYARIVAEAAALRRVRKVHTEQLKALSDGTGTAREYALDAQEALSEAVQGLQQGGFVAMSELVDRAIGHVQDCRDVEGGVTGVATGFGELDRMTTGMHPGELIVLAARPGIGKTSLAVNWSVNVAVAGGAVGIFSLEMPAMQLALRALSSAARVGLRKLREGGLSDHDMGKISTAAAQLCDAPIFVDDTAAITLADLRARSKVLKQQQPKLALLVVDYLQLLGRGGKWQNREAEVGENSRGLKQVAKELAVPVLALAQMNRKVEERAGGKPMLSDLRESGSIEADADVVMFIHPDDVDESEKTRDRKPVNLVIAKQRNGPTGEVPLDLLSEFTRFEPRPWERESS